VAPALFVADGASLSNLQEIVRQAASTTVWFLHPRSFVGLIVVFMVRARSPRTVRRPPCSEPARKAEYKDNWSPDTTRELTPGMRLGRGSSGGRVTLNMIHPLSGPLGWVTHLLRPGYQLPVGCTFARTVRPDLVRLKVFTFGRVLHLGCRRPLAATCATTQMMRFGWTGLIGLPGRRPFNGDPHQRSWLVADQNGARRPEGEEARAR